MAGGRRATGEELVLLGYCSHRRIKKITIIIHVLTYLLTYLLIPWCRVLLEKLTGSQLAKKFPAFYGPRRFITAVTSVHHLSLS